MTTTKMNDNGNNKINKQDTKRMMATTIEIPPLLK
jgi:hypothetical protein